MCWEKAVRDLAPSEHPVGHKPSDTQDLQHEIQGHVAVQNAFPTKRRPTRRQLDTQTPMEEVTIWVKESGLKIGDCAATTEQKEKAARLLFTWKDVFSTGLEDMEETDLVKHTIPLKPNSKPVVMKDRLWSRAEIAWMEENLPRLERTGVICTCSSPWNSRLKLVPKKAPGEFCFVNQFMKLNDATAKVTYPIPRPETILETLFQPELSVYFACDGSNAYWGVPLVEKDRYKTAFNTPRGQYCMRVMVQGLTGAPFNYSKLADLTFGAIPPVARRVMRARQGSKANNQRACISGIRWMTRMEQQKILSRCLNFSTRSSSLESNGRK